jgi:hypothetical protein
MAKYTQRRALRAGLVIKQCRRGMIIVDPTTGKSVYDGNRSSKSPGHERRIDAFIRKAERCGLD